MVVGQRIHGDDGEKMSSDTMRFCFHGRHIKPRSEFRSLPGVKPKREVCQSCYETVMRFRKEKQQ
jgi:hypothetical protein